MLAHSFKGFSPQLAAPRQEHHGRRERRGLAPYFIADKKQSKGPVPERKEPGTDFVPKAT